jgi:putative sulfotransferase
MLSDLVNEHREALSLSEFFASLDPLGFTGGDMDGAAFWAMLSTPRLKPNTLLRKGVTVPEYRYPLGSGRYAAGEVPAISLMTLPPLTADPDALYDSIRDEVTRWPTAPLSRQYVRLFDWWAAFLGRAVVIERSGASVRFLPDVISYFPEARFVHMYRHGPDCAMSMSRYPLARLALLIAEMRRELGVDPFQVHDPAHAQRLPERLRPFTPDTLDASALAHADIPLEWFAALWSQGTARATAYLAELPPERLLHISYDKIVADPVPELTRFGRFAGLPDVEAWADRVSGRVDAGRTGAANSLSAQQATELHRGCALGVRSLAEFLNLPDEAGCPASGASTRE